MINSRTSAKNICHTPSVASAEPTDFNGVYVLYKDAIFRYCLSKSRDPDVGQDLMQETFLRFWLCLQRDEKVLLARALLYRIAHNLFIDYVRKKREDSLDQLLEKGFEPTSDPWHQTHVRLDVEKPLEKLRAMPVHYKEVLQRRFLQGLNPADIAASTGETANVVSVRIFRGLQHLRMLLA